MAKIVLPAGTDLNRLYEVHKLALGLLHKHGLTNWELKWDRATKRAGYCDAGLRQISLSTPLMAIWSMDDVLDTILHEIAHALTPGHGHDDVWLAMCRKVGAKPSRYYSIASKPQVKLRWEGTCPNGHTFYQARKTKNMGKTSCSQCSPRWDKRYTIQWIDTEEG